MDFREIFRAPYGYQESTYLESKKDIIIQKLEIFFKDLQDKFNGEINQLKEENKVINQKIENITKGDLELDMGTFTYGETIKKTMKKTFKKIKDLSF